MKRRVHPPQPRDHPLPAGDAEPQKRRSGTRGVGDHSLIVANASERYSTSMSIVRSSAITGHPTTVLTRLRRKVGALGRHGGFHLKVGITANPESRWSRGYAQYGWKRMVLVYQSQSHDHVCTVEKALVRHLPFTRSRGWYHNSVAGGGGRKPSMEGPYYVYVVWSPKYARVRHW